MGKQQRNLLKEAVVAALREAIIAFVRVILKL